jgi:PQQ-like domain
VVKPRRCARVVVAVVASALLLAGCDWAQLGFGPAGTSYDPIEPALTETSVAHLAADWSVECACWPSRPLVAMGTVYAVDGYAGEAPFPLTLRAFDATSGTPRWSVPLGTSRPGDVLAAVANGLVYLSLRPTSGSDQLVALDAATGKTRWQVVPPAPGSGPVVLGLPIVDGAQVFVSATASDASEVSAFDALGQRVWSVVPGGRVFEGSNLATVPGQTLYVATGLALSNGQGLSLLKGYAVSDGAARSAALIPDPTPVQTIAAADGLVYGTWFTAFGRLGSVGGFAVHPDTGALAWSGGLFEQAVAPDAVLTNNPRDATLEARDPMTGAVKWTTFQSGFGAEVAGALVVSSEGDIRRLSDGVRVGAVRDAVNEDLIRTTPANGRIFAVAATHLYAVSPQP